jgi:hypothetical protein
MGCDVPVYGYMCAGVTGSITTTSGSDYVTCGQFKQGGSGYSMSALYAPAVTADGSFGQHQCYAQTYVGSGYSFQSAIPIHCCK